MPWQSVQPPTPVCPSCKTKIFSQEAYMVADRKPFHRNCLKCDRCHKTLTPANLNTMVEEVKIFCQTCYNDAVISTLNEISVPIPEKVKMQVLPVEGNFKVEKKPIPKEGPTEERLKHEAIVNARMKAWDELQKLTNTKDEDKSVRIMDALSW